MIILYEELTETYKKIYVICGISLLFVFVIYFEKNKKPLLPLYIETK